jgi:hypothetical protein
LPPPLPPPCRRPRNLPAVASSSCRCGWQGMKEYLSGVDERLLAATPPSCNQ